MSPRVSEIFKDLDLDELAEKASNADPTDYDFKTYSFVTEVWEKDIAFLSKAQVNWLERISDSN